MPHAFGYRPFPENASQVEIIAHKHDEPDVSDVLTRLHKWTIKTVTVTESSNNQLKPKAIEYEQGVFEKIRASGP